MSKTEISNRRMRTLVFAGPTLEHSTILDQLPDATVRGPVACGDVWHSTRQGYELIAIIDGTLDQRQPVWHKEILWALAQGVLVFGAASMGALRAAELAPFGMRGVGVVYAAFANGILEADDEVVVAHEAEARGFRPLSEALVNIRATLKHALEARVIGPELATHLIELARETFYPDRTFANLLERSEATPAERTRLLEWLGPQFQNVTNQKRIDAIELLDVLGNVQRNPAPFIASQPKFEFSTTHFWQGFQRHFA